MRFGIGVLWGGMKVSVIILVVIGVIAAIIVAVFMPDQSPPHTYGR